MSEQMGFSNGSIPIATIMNNIKQGRLDLQPDYQRGYIWDDDFQDKLIYSIVKNYPIGNVSVRNLREPNSKGARQEIVDGQQRLTSIKRFIDEEHMISNEWARKILDIILEYYSNVIDEKENSKLVKLINRRGRIKLKFSDLPFAVQDNIQSYNVALTYISDASNKQIREYFRFLQNQERLRAGEIINSMPATELENFKNQIDDKERFLNVIGFQDDRKEFDKIFYSIIGLFDLKIPFGTTDKCIQNYAANAKSPIEGMENSLRMIEQINIITNSDMESLDNTRKRFLKYLLLLSGMGYVDFSTDTYKKLNTLKEIDDKMSSFFSAKANIYEESFSEYSESTRNELRYIALIAKGGHSYSRVDNRMKILAYYVNNDEKTITSGVKLLET